MSALSVLAEARALGIVVEAAGDRIKARRPSGVPPAFVEKLRAHKPELLRLLTCYGEAELPARARQRIKDAASRMGCDPAVILRQFDTLTYPANDMRELLAWPDVAVEAHIRLLLHEFARSREVPR